ncbi:MAG: hypothetical protein VB031_02255 [Eubacteriaceae bacterium]|nr:hypothetical protein [Eubacteriaceae bacterium]
MSEEKKRKQRPLEQRWAEEEEGVRVLSDGDGKIPEQDPDDTIDDFIRTIEEAQKSV